MAEIKSPTIEVKGEYKALKKLVRFIDEQIEKNASVDARASEAASHFAFPQYCPNIKVWIKYEGIKEE